MSKVRPREYSTEEVGIMMQDQDLAGNPDVMMIIEEKQMMKDCLDPRVRYFPTPNVDLCDNVELLCGSDDPQEGDNCNSDRFDQSRLLQGRYSRHQQLRQN